MTTVNLCVSIIDETRWVSKYAPQIQEMHLPAVAFNFENATCNHTRPFKTAASAFSMDEPAAPMTAM